MTNSINETPFTNLMFIIGANPTEAHPIIGAKMRQALRRGAKLIVADPRKTEMAGKADIWLRLRPGTDIALINGLMRIILKSGWHKQDFIDSCTNGVDAVAAGVEKYTPEYVEQITGVPQDLLYKAAELYGTAERAQIFYTMGITEHICGTDNVMCLANLSLMTANVGKAGAGVNPLRGQNNVQGACDMGALPNVYPGYQQIANPAVREKFEKAWGVKLSEKPGLTSPDMFDEISHGTLKAMYVMGEDPVLSDANANHVKKAFTKLDFLVVQTLFMTDTAKLADVILPAATFAEKDGTFTNTERRIQRVRRAINPIPGTMTDGDIIIQLSNRMGYPMHYKNASEVMAEITQVTPSYAGVTYERLEESGLQWPVPTIEHPGTPFLHEAGKFICGIARFVPVEHQPPAELPDAEYPLMLTTGLTLYHHRVSTVRRSKNLTKFRPKEQTMLHPDDAKQLGISDGDKIAVASRRGRVETNAWVTDIVPPGLVWMSFHFPETPTNELTNDAYDKVTKTYEYKVCAIKVEKVSETKI